MKEYIHLFSVPTPEKYREAIEISVLDQNNPVSFYTNETCSMLLCPKCGASVIQYEIMEHMRYHFDINMIKERLKVDGH